MGIHAWSVIRSPDELFTLSALGKLVLQSNKEQYLNRYIELVLRFYPLEHEQYLYEQITLFCKNNQTDLVLKNLDSIPLKRKNQILLQCREINPHSELLNKKYNDEKYRYTMYTTLKNAKAFLKGINDLPLEEVIKQKNMIMSAFDSYIENNSTNSDAKSNFRKNF